MTEFKLDPEEGKTLIAIAREAIDSYAKNGRKPDLPTALPPRLSGDQGAFVTIHKDGRLRGCIGTFTGEGDLAHTVQNMAISAGWGDPRFPNLAEDELPRTDLEISVLSPLREISDVSEIEVGRHGIFVTKGGRRGVLLPQVAVEQKWDRETFLDHVCIKAGLPRDAWRHKGIRIEVFSAHIVREKE